MSSAWRFGWTGLVLGFGALARNPLRSVLTTFGILIGVAAVTIVVALGDGAQQAISSRIDALGNNALLVRPEETAKSGARAGVALPMLSEDDAAAIAREASSVAVAAPLLLSFAQVSYSDANASAQVIGSTRGFFAVRAWKTRSGDFWPASSENLGEKVCVIGTSLKTTLFGDADPIGRTLRIGRHPFVIVGLLDSKGQGPTGQDMDNVVVMPIATARSKLIPTRPGQAHVLLLSSVRADGADQVERDVTAILRQRHRLSEGMENDFRIRSQEEFRKTQEGIVNVLRALLFGIALVSLAVGGIGVMNIMLVSVAERTREIGIRLAIGARENDILVQFLVEAAALALAGGVAGSILAGFAVAAIGGWLGWPMALSPRALAIALATSAGVGLVFGLLPARRAARLDPIVALRRE
jgi:putative ABC transport system permease protein